ncbi:MAG: bile acid:sodium symporter [Myxococcales bacterium]|nr:bile acid:sodium symporter [Myxococcales bacterium]
MSPAARDAIVAALVATVMLSVGLGLEPRALRAVLSRPAVLVRGLVFEHVGIPALAWLLGSALGLSGSALAALVLCAATPGGPVGPAFTLQAGGNVALAVTLVVVTAVTNVVAAPAVVRLLGLTAGVGVLWPLVQKLLCFQLAPLASGMLARRALGSRAERARRAAEVVSKVLIGGLVVGMTATQWRLFGEVPLPALAAIVACCVAAIVLAGVVVGGGREDRIAAGLTAGIRNLGLALLVATAVFVTDDPADHVAMLIVMMYGLVMMVVTAAASALLGRRGTGAERSAA